MRREGISRAIGVILIDLTMFACHMADCMDSMDVVDGACGRVLHRLQAVGGVARDAVVNDKNGSQ